MRDVRPSRFIDIFDPNGNDLVRRRIGWVLLAAIVATGAVVVGTGVGIIIVEHLVALGAGVLMLGVMTVITPWLVRPVKDVNKKGFVVLGIGLLGNAVIGLNLSVGAGVLFAAACLAMAMFLFFRGGTS